MDIFNDFDLCQEAMKKIDLSEAIMPVVRGVIVEDVDTYNKIQRLLNTPALEPCHRFLYNLDVEQLAEDEVNKVNNLYKLGQDRGFIPLDEPDAEDDVAAQPADVAPEPAPQPPAPKPSPVDNVAFTVAYSAMKDGMMKTGEAYSNAVSTRAAKADVISKLERAGYSSIEILCIEAGDPDVRGCSSTYCMQADKPPMTEADDDSDSDSDSDSGSDDSGDDSNSGDSDSSDDSDSDSDDSDDDSKDDSDSDSDDDSEDKDDDSDDDDEKEEDAEEPDEKLDDQSDDKAETATDDKEEKDLTAEEKVALRDSYKKAFKAAMQKCKFETSFSELALDDKVKFFTELSKAWGDKADPSKFMSDKEVDQLEKIVIKKK